jgi:hypothetical protein
MMNTAEQCRHGAAAYSAHALTFRSVINAHTA